MCVPESETMWLESDNVNKMHSSEGGSIATTVLPEGRAVTTTISPEGDGVTPTTFPEGDEVITTTSLEGDEVTASPEGDVIELSSSPEGEEFRTTTVPNEDGTARASHQKRMERRRQMKRRQKIRRQLSQLESGVEPLSRRELWEALGLEDMDLTEAELQAFLEEPIVENLPPLADSWDDMWGKWRSKGKLMLPSTKEGSEKLWIARVDRRRAYNSLTAGASVKCRSGGSLVKMKVVVDTGACCSIIQDKVYNDMGKPELFPVDGIRLHDAGGHSMEIMGLARVQMKLGGQEVLVDMLVIKDLEPTMILGVDFMERSKAIIDFGKMEMRIPGMSPIKVSCSPDNHCRSGQVTTLAPRETSMLWVRVPSDYKEGETVLVNEHNLTDGVYVARTVGTVVDDKVAVQICNTKSEVVKISGTQLISTLSRLDPQRIEVAKGVYGRGQDQEEDIIDDQGRSLPIPTSVSRYADMDKGLHVAVVSDSAGSTPLEDGLSHLTEKQQAALQEAVEPYASMFFSDPSRLPGAAKDCEARILGGGDQPIAQHPYRTAPWKRKIIQEQVDALLDQDLIELTTSPWAAPVVLVEKPSSPGQWRLCVDYRKLNEVTDAVRWPLPRMDDTIAQLADYKWFTTLDLAWGFWAVPLDKRDREKTAFVTEEGQYQWKRLPMGWQGAPATFQRAMDIMLAGLKGVSVLVYVDDLIIFSQTFEAHVQDVAEVCRRLHQAGRAVKLSKARWARSEVDFLGFTIGKGFVKAQPKKVQNILEITPPKNLQALQSYLGAMGVYRQFMPDYAILADPLYKCASGDRMQPWTVKCQRAFTNLKLALEHMAALELPMGNAEQAIQVDGDRHGFGGVLLQRVDGRYPWKPIQFVSGVHRGGDARRAGPERAVIAVARILKKVKCRLNQGATLNIFCNEPGLSFVLDPEAVGGRAQKAVLQIGAYKVKWGQAPGKFVRFGGLFIYNSPELEARKMAIERRKVEAQQRAVVLDNFSDVTIPDAWVVTFDGGYRRAKTSGHGVGGNGWTVWDVVQDNWHLVKAHGEFTRESDDCKTTVNVEEFEGLCSAMEYMGTQRIRTTHVFGDSRLVIGALQGKSQCRAEHMQEALKVVEALVEKLEVKPFFWQVSRDFNSAADWMANQAMDGESTVDSDEDAEVGQVLAKLHGESLSERIYAKPVLTPCGDKESRIFVLTRAQAKLRQEQCDEQGRVLPWKRIRQGQLSTPWMKAYLAYLEDGQTVAHKAELAVHHFAVHLGVLWLTSTRAEEDWRLVVPPLMRADVMAEHHDGKIGGHLRGRRLKRNLRVRYYWPRMLSDIEHYERTCGICQLVKGRLKQQKVPMSAIREVTTHPFQTVAIDSIVNLPVTTEGYKYIVVVVCYYSRYPIAIAVKDISMDTFVDVVMTSLITTHGCPDRILTDRGGQFIGDLAKSLYRYLRCRKQSTTSYHPQANGLCERFNGTLVQGLKTMAADHPKDWNKELPWFLFAYRTTIHAVTQCTPFELVHGRMARLPYDVMLRDFQEMGLRVKPREYLRRMLVSIGENRERIRQLTKTAREKADEYDSKKHKPRTYVEGQQVWLYHPAVPQGIAPKLWIPWRGPFRIAKCVTDTVYRLETKSGEAIKQAVTVNRLMPFQDRASWPKHEVEDQQDEALMEIPDEGDPMRHEVGGVPAEIQEVIGERFIPRRNGAQREYRVIMKSQTGRLSERWLNEKKIVAGDLIYLYRAKLFDVERAKDLEVQEGDTMVWEKKSSGGVNGVLRSGLEGMPSMGMLSRNDAGKGHWKKAGDLDHEAGGLADGVDDVTSLPVTVGNDEFGQRVKSPLKES